jgi:hypothetical protein
VVRPRYLKNDAGATHRLVSTFVDATVDLHLDRAGTYDPALAAANPSDPFAGNVPYKIQGKCTAEPAVDLLPVGLPPRRRSAHLGRHARRPHAAVHFPEPAFGGLLAGSLLLAQLPQGRRTVR